MAAQLVHASGESSPGNLPVGTYAVVLQVPSEDSLLAVADDLTQVGLDHIVVVEPDRNNEATAIGVVPIADRKRLKKVLSRLPLLKDTGEVAQGPCGHGRAPDLIRGFVL